MAKKERRVFGADVTPALNGCIDRLKTAVSVLEFAKGSLPDELKLSLVKHATDKAAEAMIELRVKLGLWSEEDEEDEEEPSYEPPSESELQAAEHNLLAIENLVEQAASVPNDSEARRIRWFTQRLKKLSLGTQEEVDLVFQAMRQMQVPTIGRLSQALQVVRERARPGLRIPRLTEFVQEQAEEAADDQA